MMTINNVDLEPMAIEGGKWTWNGYEITHHGVTMDGVAWQRKGQCLSQHQAEVPC